MYPPAKISPRLVRLLSIPSPSRRACAVLMLEFWTDEGFSFFCPFPFHSRVREGKGKERANLVAGDSEEASTEEQMLNTSGETMKPPKGSIGVTQRLGGIMQKNKFVAEDIQPLEDPAERDVDGDSDASDASSFDGFDEANDAEDASEEEMT